MIRFSLIVLLLAGLTASMGCFFGGSAPEGPERLVPDGAKELVIADVSESALSRTALPSHLESPVAALADFGDVRRQVRTSLSSGAVTISGGAFDFDKVRETLANDGYSESEYRDYELWESGNGRSAFALMPDDGFLLQGDPGAVIDVLRDASRDSGQLWNDGKGELKRAMDRTGDGFVVTASENCRLEPSDGCLAAAWAFARGERLTVIEGSIALLFSSPEAAASAAPRIETAIHAIPLITLTEILTDKTVVTLKADVDREDFAQLRFPIALENP